MSIAENARIPNAAVFLKRTALEFLQIVFSQRAIGSFHYDLDDTVTEILIADVHAVDLQSVSVRPSIIGVRGPLSVQPASIGSVESRNLSTGSYTFNDLLTGSVAFSCISREGIEAEQIGHLVFNSFKVFRPVLQKYGFFTIKSLSIGAETLVEQEGANDLTTVVPIYITAQIQDRWLLDSSVEKQLKKVVIEHLIQD